MPAEFDVDALTDAYEDLSREEAGELSRRWNSAAQESLVEQGDDRGYDVFPIVQSFTPSRWDDSRNAWVFDITHEAARYLNDGTQTHEIVADDGVLAFEWPDAPREVREMFAATFPTVFFRSVEVDGIDAMNFMERGADEAIRGFETARE